MKIALGADHAGFDLKERLREHLRSQGHEVQDFGTHSAQSTDYPDYAAQVARTVAGGGAERGLLVCGSGIGMAIAANKVDGIRAINGYDETSARLARAHNDANLITVGSRTTQPGEAEQIVDTFLDTAFDGGRHQHRVDKITALE